MKIKGGEKRQCLKDLVHLREQELDYLRVGETPFKYDCWNTVRFYTRLRSKGLSKPTCRVFPYKVEDSVEFVSCQKKKIKNGEKRHCYRDLVRQRESEFNDLLNNYESKIEGWKSRKCSGCDLDDPVLDYLTTEAPAHRGD
jgi:hypothetical protein